MPPMNPGTDCWAYPGQIPHNATMRDFPILASSATAALPSRSMRPRSIDCHHLARMKLGRKHRGQPLFPPPSATLPRADLYHLILANLCRYKQNNRDRKYIPNDIVLFTRCIYLLYRFLLVSVCS